MDLRSAVRRGDLVLAKLILDEINATGGPTETRKALITLTDGASALHLAIGTKQILMANLLLKFGADPDQYDGYGYAPMHLSVLAAEQGARRRRVRWLEGGEDVERRLVDEERQRVRSIEQGSATAGNSGNASSAASYSSTKRSTGHRSRARSTALALLGYSASKGGSKPANRSIGLAKEERETPFDKTARPPTAMPLEMGDLTYVEILLGSGAHPDLPRLLVSRGESSSSPLFEATFQGEVELVRLLLRHGADPGVVGWARDSPYKESCLHIAARRKSEQQVEVCKLLLQHGADPLQLCGDPNDLVDASFYASTTWIKSMIQGLQLAEKTRLKALEEEALDALNRERKLEREEKERQRLWREEDEARIERERTLGGDGD
mmetsp:Transcript_67872/g.153599  ORF Transcript_67872/g.153599 Transcript_67872/m.153599 type:complete len:380 (-) Transcript_67872:205-1344(-)